ncbi:hypothetical protein KNU89_gp054 [Phage NBEco003]|uniref:Uncharacterized protein n=1 Tax=Phage NBEco003 TaxID=2712972 RepID=A0A6G8QX11_9CAUD|nr:hypothetical protein KNU89_gp054 [Phage NBEco003]QIN92180.1 hypothetical protein [Phage NBEco003]
MAWHHETWSIVIVNSGLVGTSNGQLCGVVSVLNAGKLLMEIFNGVAS